MVTNARLQYVILTAFPLPQCLCERASMLRDTYIACHAVLLGSINTAFHIVNTSNRSPMSASGKETVTKSNVAIINFMLCYRTFINNVILQCYKTYSCTAQGRVTVSVGEPH